MRRTGATTMLAGLLLAGCGDEGTGASTGTDDVAKRTTTASAASELNVSVRATENGAARTWTLRCDPASGNHPDAVRACAALSAAREPFRPVPADAACTMVYGGPQTATITGTWKGERVHATYRRTDGCEIARWEALAPVFPIDTGPAAG